MSKYNPKTKKERIAFQLRRREERKRYRLRHPERVKASRNVSRDRWKTANRQKVRVHCMVRTALENGSLIKPAKCEMRISPFCGRVKNLHAHHEDYSKPLEVIWACQDCHMEYHRLERLRLEP